MARESAKRLRELVANGAEIPYDVDEADSASPLCQYKPLTDRFIGDHQDALRALDSFGAACAAIESADLAGPYLEQMGVNVPAEPRRRAELAGIAFLCRLWMESTDFSLEPDRLEGAISEFDAPAEIAAGDIEVIVPLRGLQLPVERLSLAAASIVRADTVEVPKEARAFEGSGAAAWEPTFLAVCRIEAGDGDDSDDAGARAVAAYKTLITTLRLFKPGGVALGSDAWTRVGGGRWRKIATGAGRPRPGGYRLAETELGDLTAFSRALDARTTPFGRPAGSRSAEASPLGRAISRFEAGLERHAVVEALNDYLLALRFLLEGGGPADLGLPMRVAALCAEPDQREPVKALLDRAVALEKELWSGEPAPIGDRTPAQIAADVEDLARAILKDAACGHLGGDLRVTADEILLADGLAAGEGDGADRGETAEWGSFGEDVEVFAEDARDEQELGTEGEEPEPSDVPEPMLESFATSDVANTSSVSEEPSFGWGRPVIAEKDHAAEAEENHEPEKEGRPAPRIQVHMREPEPEPEATMIEAETTRLAVVDAPPEAPRPEREGRSPVAELLEIHSREREARADRISNLFPRPETTEWNVRELSYDRRQPAGSAG
jgi:hypothetical protein